MPIPITTEINMTTRPQYETQSDLNNEQQTINAFCSKYNYSYKKLPIRYKLDFATFRPSKELAGFVEVKCRKFSWSQFPTLILALDKITAMQQALDLGIKSILLLRNQDGIFFWKYDPQNIHSIKWGGRSISPRDNQDEEPVAHIHKDAFRTF